MYDFTLFSVMDLYVNCLDHERYTSHCNFVKRLCFKIPVSGMPKLLFVVVADINMGNIYAAGE